MKGKTRTYDLVIGLGISGASMAKFLHAKGRKVIATDIDASRKPVADELNALGIETQIGFHDQMTFNRARVLIPSPGISLGNSYINTAVKSGVPVTGELDIFSAYNTLPVIAITGTNGKTTTAMLICEMLMACGMNPFVGGNVGTPLVDQLMDSRKYDIIVAEISSFQLDISQRFRPDVGILLNVSEDHLDRYENYAAYDQSKWHLFKQQRTTDAAVINQAINSFDSKINSLKSKIYLFSSRNDSSIQRRAVIRSGKIDIKTEDTRHCINVNQLMTLQGIHNQENIAAALLGCIAMGADIHGLKTGLNQFKNLPHRLEFIRKINSISFYNDSKATNTNAVISALQCFGKNIILILGGREKGTDFSLLKTSVKASVKTIIAIGESKEKIQEALKDTCAIQKVENMEAAVIAAFNAADRNDTVLLAPACASFDMYENYAARGNDFKDQVFKLGTR